MKIDWDKVWKDYKKWCGVSPLDKSKFPWMIKIQSLVEAQLKPKRRKK